MNTYSDCFTCFLLDGISSRKKKREERKREKREREERERKRNFLHSKGRENIPGLEVYSLSLSLSLE